jgi:membrane-associated HD superfamily phosphohydrolase
MRPRTKETAILMLIDSIEAGARTVEPPTHQSFEELVRRVIFSKLKQGQLDDSTLTLQDLHVLASRITDTLVSVYHGRIRYPWQNERGSDHTPSEPEAARAEGAERADDSHLH